MSKAKRSRMRPGKSGLSTQKGRSLERLMAYLFVSAGGFQVKTNVSTFDEELDLVVRNLATTNPILQEFGRYILVECKNIEGRVDAKTVRDFSSKVITHSCKTGVIISKKGYSGQREMGAARDARLAMIKAHQRHEIIIVPLNFSHLRDVIQGRKTLGDVLLQQYEKIRFDMKDF